MNGLTENDVILTYYSSEQISKLAKSYVDRICFEKFLEKIQQEQNSSVKHMLTLVCQLFALCKIEQNLGFYLTHKFLSPARAKEVPDEVEKLCAELRPYAKVLAFSMGIPKFMVELAPMIYDPKVPGDVEFLNGYVDYWDENVKSKSQLKDSENEQLQSEASQHIQTIPISAKL